MRKMLAMVGVLALLIIGGASRAVPTPLVPFGGDGSSDIQIPLPLVPFGGDGSS